MPLPLLTHAGHHLQHVFSRARNDHAAAHDRRDRLLQQSLTLISQSEHNVTLRQHARNRAVRVHRQQRADPFFLQQGNCIRDLLLRTDGMHLRAFVGEQAAQSDPMRPFPTVHNTPPINGPPARLAPPQATAPRSATDLRIRRLVVAEGVEGREPVAPRRTFARGELERVYAFVEVENPERLPGDVVVSFEPADGPAIGNVPLAVGAAPRWRTWAFSRAVDRPGEWTAVVRDGEGRVLAREPFTVTL